MTNNYVKFPIHHFPPSVSWGSLCMHVLVYILCGGGDIKALSTHRVYQLALLPSFYCMMSWAQHAPALRTIAVYTFPSSFFFFFFASVYEVMSHKKLENVHRWNDWDMKMSKIPIQDLICFLLSMADECLLPHHLWWLGLLRGLHSVTQLPGHTFLVRNR